MNLAWFGAMIAGKAPFPTPKRITGGRTGSRRASEFFPRIDIDDIDSASAAIKERMLGLALCNPVHFACFLPRDEMSTGRCTLH